MVSFDRGEITSSDELEWQTVYRVGDSVEIAIKAKTHESGNEVFKRVCLYRPSGSKTSGRLSVKYAVPGHNWKLEIGGRHRRRESLPTMWECVASGWVPLGLKRHGELVPSATIA